MDFIKLFEKNKCFLILNPIGIDASSMATIYSEYINRTYEDTFIITHSNKNSKSLLNERDNTKVLNYEEFMNMGNKKNKIFIFDDINNVIPLIEIKNYLNLNTIIIFFTLGVEKTKLEKMNQIYPNSVIYYSKFSDMGTDIKFEISKSKMTSLQTISYLEKYIEEMEIENEKKIAVDCFSYVKDYSKEKKIVRNKKAEIQSRCNIFYPEEKNKNQINKIMQNKIIYTRENINSFLENSPKFKELLSNIMLNRDKRHYVFTRFKGIYGLDILKYMFLYNDLNVYVHDDETCCTSEIINNFNDDIFQGRIFLTNLVISTPKVPAGIDFIHMVDGSLNNTMTILSGLYKYKNYLIQNSIAPSIAIFNYISLKSNGKKDTYDVEEYEAEQKIITDHLNFYNSTMDTVKPIIIDENGDLIVEECKD